MQDENEIPPKTTDRAGRCAPDRGATEAEAVEAAAEDEGAHEPEEPSEVANTIAKMGLTRMSLQELKDKAPADLLAFAELFEIENANSMRKQDMMFAILKVLAEEGVEISGSGTLEVVQDGFGFLRSPEANYLPGPDDIYVSPSQIRKFGLRTGDTRRRRHPRAARGRALLRPGEGRPDQLREPRERPPQGAVRQPDAALSRRAAEDGDRRPDPEGPLRPGHRHRRAARQGPALPDHRAARGSARR